MQKATKRNMFTLVEIMVVISIIGIIAGFGIPKFAEYRDAAKAREKVTNIQRLITAIEAFTTNDNVGETARDSWDAGVYKYIKGGAASLTADGIVMTDPTHMNTADLDGTGTPAAWVPYAAYGDYSATYDGKK